eukprot:GHRQ01026073.1.p1 GENE.GHRQ01026073.1~~GHRQ01026073.1.p1  ORF type:complete len:157 (-),score=9.17 GHRQ01026073.1:108-578(-)
MPAGGCVAVYLPVKTMILYTAHKTQTSLANTHDALHARSSIRMPRAAALAAQMDHMVGPKLHAGSKVLIQVCMQPNCPDSPSPYRHGVQPPAQLARPRLPEDVYAANQSRCACSALPLSAARILSWSQACDLETAAFWGLGGVSGPHLHAPPPAPH